MADEPTDTLEEFIRNTYGVEILEPGYFESFHRRGDRDNMEEMARRLGVTFSEFEETAKKQEENAVEHFCVSIPAGKYEREYAFDAMIRYYEEKGFGPVTKPLQNTVSGGFVMSVFLTDQEKTTFVNTLVIKPSAEANADVMYQVNSVE